MYYVIQCTETKGDMVATNVIADIVLKLINLFAKSHLHTYMDDGCVKFSTIYTLYIVGFFQGGGGEFCFSACLKYSNNVILVNLKISL